MANTPIDILADPRLNVTIQPKRGAFQCIEITPPREPQEDGGAS